MDAKAELVALLPCLRRFAIGLTGSREQADDLVQTACLKALERWHQWTPGTSLKSWTFRIVQTTWIDQKRYEARRPTTSDETVLATLPDRASDGAQERRQTLRRVRDHIAELPENQRAALLLVAVEGLSYREASDVLQVPIGTVMSRLARARAGLSARLENAAKRDAS